MIIVIDNVSPESVSDTWRGEGHADRACGPESRWEDSHVMMQDDY